MPGKILIVDDISTNRIVLKVKLSSAFYQVLQARSAKEAAALITSERPDLVLASARLPDVGAIELCALLQAAAGDHSLPIVLIDTEDLRDVRLERLRAGADDVLTKPLDDLQLLARVRSLLRLRSGTEELRRRSGTVPVLDEKELALCDAQGAHVKLCTDAPPRAIRWQKALQKRFSEQVSTVLLRDAMRGLHEGAHTDAFVIQLSEEAPETALRLIADARSRSETRDAAVIAIMPTENRRLAADALDLGANDVLCGGFDVEELSVRLARQITRKRRTEMLRDKLASGLRAAVTDPLTGLYNRRYAMPQLAEMAQASVQNGEDCAVILADLDHFKSVNDRFGHAAGDSVLCEVAKRLRDNLRSVDMVARIGGEEFLIVMPNTTLHEAHSAASRLCRIIGQTPVRDASVAHPVPITISIGLAMCSTTLHADGDHARTMLEQADKALYDAKAQGRNQVTLSRLSAA